MLRIIVDGGEARKRGLKIEGARAYQAIYRIILGARRADVRAPGGAFLRLEAGRRRCEGLRRAFEQVPEAAITLGELMNGFLSIFSLGLEHLQWGASL